jgi:hypothetical protein
VNGRPQSASLPQAVWINLPAKNTIAQGAPGLLIVESHLRDDPISAAFDNGASSLDVALESMAVDRRQRVMDPQQEPSTQPLPPVRPVLGLGTLRDCTTIVIVALLVAVVLRPFQDRPFIDDWVYSWPVQHLLDTHEFLFPELVGNPIAAQVLWGALFCLPFGFSLTVLRISTWVLGVLALCALYLLVRESGSTWRSALMATAVLGFNPVFLSCRPPS